MNESIIAQILETLNRIEGKVDTNHTQLATRLDKHMEDEEGEMSLLTNSISDTRHESEMRHTALIQSINSYMDKSIAIESAFLKAHDGTIDLHGHYEDHDTRKKISDWFSEARNKSLLKVAEYGTLSFFIWFLYTVWDTILKGPHK